MIRFLNRSRPTQVQQLQSLLDSSCPKRSMRSCQGKAISKVATCSHSSCSPRHAFPSARIPHLFHKGIIRSLVQSSRFRPAARPEPAVGAETSFGSRVCLECLPYCRQLELWYHVKCFHTNMAER
jgi:hypothetical protein